MRYALAWTGILLVAALAITGPYYWFSNRSLTLWLRGLLRRNR